MPEVRDTIEFRRVANLPRRRLSERDAVAWGKTLTEELRLPGSRAELFPWQGYSLAEAAENRGAWLALGVGHGKTLITYLLPTILEAKRPLLIVPGPGLRDKTWKDFGAYLPHWREPSTPIQIYTLHDIAPESGEKLLSNMKPDLVMIDEFHKVANASASAATRIDRYIASDDSVMTVVLSGTPGRKSIMNYWHTLCWVLRDRAPVPLDASEARMWAAALDEGKGRSFCAVEPGPLGATQKAARAWYQKRLAQTPGVVIVDGDSCKAPLLIRTRLAREDARLDVAFKNFLTTFETPGGEFVSDSLSRWRLDGHMGCGVYKRYRPPPPDEWREARRALAKLVRDKIAHSKHSARPLDTEAQVLKRYSEHEIVVRWKEIRDTFVENTEAVWVTDSTIHSVRDWLAESDAPGIVWSGCVAFGEALAVTTRLPYYGPQGRNQDGGGLHDADELLNMIASWAANKEGFNLQAWTRQLVVCPPQSAQYLEQIFGRSHRRGQEKLVTIDVLATSGGTLDAFETAIAEAGFGTETMGLTQKIQRATIQRAVPRITQRNRYRWARRDVRPSRVVLTDRIFGKAT